TNRPRSPQRGEEIEHRQNPSGENPQRFRASCRTGCRGSGFQRAGEVHTCLNLDLGQRIAAIRNIAHGRVVFTTSFGIEDQAVTHAICSQALAVDLVTFDTGRLFPQTYELWAKTERRYGRRIQAFYPDCAAVEALVGRQGINGFYTSVEARQV